MVAPAILAIPSIVKGIVWLGAALGITHMVAPGKEEREQSILDLGNAIAGNNSSAMSNAQDDAKANADSGTAAATCATGECGPPPECKELNNNIKKLTEELSNRRAAMLADRPVSQGGLGMYELFLKDPLAKIADPRGIKSDLGNWQGHHDQIIEKQRNMKRELKKHKKKKCGPLPTGSETQSDLPPPDKPFGY